MSIAEFRTPQAQVDRLFVERWSPRAFSTRALDEGQIATLFEAARWSPSSFNLQPWLFLYETSDGPARADFEAVMVPLNREWASKAPLLVLALSELGEGDAPGSSRATFDSGAAWMALALQARTMGLYSHAMGGIDRDVAHERLNIPRDKYSVNCMIAVGHLGDPSELNDELRERETPSERKDLATVAHRGPLRGG